MSLKIVTSKETFILLRFFGRIGCSWRVGISLAEEEVKKKKVQVCEKGYEERVCYID